ncbi:MAG TPA: aminotransferase class III-fold pyridoxal phosphate-dependent enzyme [Candidatus Binataceae bacterium]|jgi:glutamate-1-semialdehyde 2,1-aminomutase|nr:aminotransferase class III-fold pyridoxal phosphate-dependent enzyme [Candidatus Binataceae bacterium]
MLADDMQRWAARCLGVNTGAPWKLDAWHGWILAGAVLAFLIAASAIAKLVRLVFTLRAVALAPSLTRPLSKWVRSLDYSDDEFLRADGAAERWVEIRKLAIDRLAGFFQAQSAKSIAWGNEIRESFSDLRFTDANRVPFPFMRAVRDKFNLCSVVTESNGPKLRDLDGHWNLDVSGSYGLNVAGFDRYKEWMEKGWERVRNLGPVLGPLHPIVAENIALLKSISKLDEVSFHMSGTEAVMAAVRLARFNTRRKLIVSFSGAYHGWWDGVQPGLGSERTITDCLTLKDLHPASIDLIRRRAKEIAGVLINPVQSFHPNLPPPSDTVLLTSGVRKTQDSTSHYAQWLRKLREVCTECGIPLIFDEVFSGFRLAPGGAQEYFGVPADMVVYGKTVAGGMPIGLVCGKKELMRRFDPEHPMRIAYVIGTFSAHPLVMGAMNEFLRWLGEPATAKLYQEANSRCEEWVRSTNQKLVESSVPLRVMNLATVWTVLFKEPGRYNWLLQYYLRAEGLMLSWVGTGRCMSSLDFSNEDYAELQAKIATAGQKMRSDGWWLNEEQQPGRDKIMRSNLIREMARSIVQVPSPLKDTYAEIMQRKRDDHVASHSNVVNQVLHLFSSSTFILCYLVFFFNFTLAVSLGVAALLLRQFGHAILEPPCHDKEKALLGYNTRNKTIILAAYVLVPVVHLMSAGSISVETIRTILPTAARQWFLLTLAVVFGRVAYLAFKHNFCSAMIWFVKLITDPITDVMAYYTSLGRMAQVSHARKSEAA